MSETQVTYVILRIDINPNLWDLTLPHYRSFMHELTFVLSIVDMAEQQVREQAATYVEQIDLEIGTLAGIEMDSLEFAWPIAVKNTVLANAQKTIHQIQARAICPDCQNEFEAESLMPPCPSCQNPLTNMSQGREVNIKSLKMG